jgi:hypothetical protein
MLAGLAVFMQLCFQFKNYLFRPYAYAMINKILQEGKPPWIVGGK